MNLIDLDGMPISSNTEVLQITKVEYGGEEGYFFDPVGTGSSIVTIKDKDGTVYQSPVTVSMFEYMWSPVAYLNPDLFFGMLSGYSHNGSNEFYLIITEYLEDFELLDKSEDWDNFIASTERVETGIAPDTTVLKLTLKDNVSSYFSLSASYITSAGKTRNISLSFQFHGNL